MKTLINKLKRLFTTNVLLDDDDINRFPIGEDVQSSVYEFKIRNTYVFNEWSKNAIITATDLFMNAMDMSSYYVKLSDGKFTVQSFHDKELVFYLDRASGEKTEDWVNRVRKTLLEDYAEMA